VLPFWPSRVVYDLIEKIDSSLDLIEKNVAESDLVYVLTEIDNQNIVRKYGRETGLSTEVMGLCAHSLRATAVDFTCNLLCN
jgi:hypothetical protein